MAAKITPRINCHLKADRPSFGGLKITAAASALTMGAPAKIIDPTAVGGPPLKSASCKQKAPIAPAMPAAVE